jgi:hypothetical protein
MSSELTDEQCKLVAWQKASPIPNFPPDVWRWDRCGTPIHWFAYGDRSNPHGWEVDHVLPSSRGGLSLAHNVEALHWRNNVAKSDGILGLLKR